MDNSQKDKEAIAMERPVGFAFDSAPSNAPPTYSAVPMSQANYPYEATSSAYVAPTPNSGYAGQTNVLIVESTPVPAYDEPQQESSYAFAFSEKSIRLAFIRKVYAILTVQLLITFGVIAIFTFIDSVRYWAQVNYWLYIASVIVVIVMVIVMACFVDLRRRFPHNIVFLFLFTAVEGVALGSICVYFDVMSVWIAAAICILLVIALTLFSLQTKIDFTLVSGVLFVLSLCFLTTLILCLVMRTYWTYIVYAGLGALIFSVYIVFDTQIMLGGKHKYSVSAEEYIFAALNLYLDIVNLFLYILMIVGGGRKG